MKQQDVDFYLIKAIINNVLTLSGITKFENVSGNNASYSSGLSFTKNKETVAELGILNKSLLRKFDISQNVIYAEIHWDTLIKYASKKAITYKEISKFPSVKRDLSMLVRKDILYEKLEKIAFDTEKKLLVDIRLFDVYEGDKIEAGKKSCAMSFILQDEEKTLTENEINQVMEKLMSAFEKQAGAEIRRAASY
jgi:phenylalanyl-tRNA synthetase beta chain